METSEKQQYAIRARGLNTVQPDIAEPKWSDEIFLGQRKRHRDSLFTFAMWMSVCSLFFLSVLVVIQTLLRVFVEPSFEVISDLGLQIIAVAIFGQVFGVVYVIAHAIWSNDEFKVVNNKKQI